MVTGSIRFEINEDVSNTPEIQIANQDYRPLRESPSKGDVGIFVEVAGCNLLCGNPTEWVGLTQSQLSPQGDATWVCDKITKWSEVNETYTSDSLLSDWEARGWLSAIEEGNIRHVVLSGGEPLLGQSQTVWADFFDQLVRRDVGLPSVQIHTNGTFVPERKLRSFVDSYIVSPKLSNSGMPESKRVNEDALHRFSKFARTSRYSESGQTTEFVFVVTSNEDVQEANMMVSDRSLPKSAVVLMVAPTQADEETVDMVKRTVLDHGYRMRKRHRGE
jgi:organic radical activating enzyme